MKNRIKFAILWIVSVMLQIVFLPTLCGEGPNEARLLIAAAIDIHIPLKLISNTAKPTNTSIQLCF